MNADESNSTDSEEEGTSPPPMSPSLMSTCRPHPLLNSVILSILFKKVCRVEDLPKCRLVCKQWRDTSLDLWRSSRTFTLDYIKIDFPEVNYDANQLQQFLEFVSNPSTKYSEKPFRNLHLKTWNFTLLTNGMFDETWIERFCWAAVGCHVTKLELTNCKFGGVEEFRQIIYKFCPNLQSLSLTICKTARRIDLFDLDRQPRQPPEPLEYQEPANGEQPHLRSLSIETYSSKCPVSWFELLSHFSSLVSFKINEDGLVRFGETDSNIFKVLKAIQIIRIQDPTKLPITELDVSPHIELVGMGTSRQVFDILRECRIPVKRISIWVSLPRGDGILDREYVKNIINFHAKSLISMQISASGRDPPPWSFPFGKTLEKLQVLKIGSEALLRDMEFLMYIPNLVELEIQITRFRGAVEHLLRPNRAENRQYPQTRIIFNTLETEELARLQLLKLTTLKFESCLSEDDLRRLVKWLPNVEKLEMVLNDRQFTVICEQWKKLTKLTVLGQDFTDEGILGRRTVGQMGEEDGAEDNPEVVEDVRPNITSLQELGYFRADSENLTEAAVLEGFLKIPKLRHVTLRKITKRAKLALGQGGVFFVLLR